MELKPGKNEARIVVVDGKECVEVTLTQGRTALCDVDDWERVREYRWHAIRHRSTFYAARTVNTAGGSRKHRMHQLIMEPKLGVEIDHVRHPGTDNRKTNLRFCDQPLNQTNTEGRGGASRFKGVSWAKGKRRWRVAFRAHGRHFFVGYFRNEEAAAVAYDQQIRQVCPEFARLNFVYTRAVAIWPETRAADSPPGP